jgi:HSP20 family protein
MMANSLMRFDPLWDLARFDPFRSSIDDIFGDFPIFSRLRGLESTQMIRIDVSETDKNYVVKAEIPGVKKEDIKVAIEGSKVSISAETKEEKDINNESMMYRERKYGLQSRSFSLPQEVDEQVSQAKYEDGVLQLTLPKKSGTATKYVAIQ